MGRKHKPAAIVTAYALSHAIRPAWLYRGAGQSLNAPPAHLKNTALIFALKKNIMIAQIYGTFLELTPTRVVIEAGGVGYELHISLYTYSALQGKTAGRLYAFLKISEDAHTLYGFAEADEKEMFIKLIAVSGVGAATARMMLSSLKPAEIAAAIMSGDARSLERVKGIGKKTAERLVVELRDKLGKGSDKAVSTLPGAGYHSVINDAIEALSALGIPRAQADAAIKKLQPVLPENASVELIIKQVLKSL